MNEDMGMNFVDFHLRHEYNGSYFNVLGEHANKWMVKCFLMLNINKFV